MVPENDLLAHFKHLFLLRILGKERGGTLTNETTYNKGYFWCKFQLYNNLLKVRSIFDLQLLHYQGKYGNRKAFITLKKIISKI